MEIEKTTRLILTPTENEILENAIELLLDIQVAKDKDSSLCPNLVTGEIDDAVGVIESVLDNIKIKG